MSSSDENRSSSSSLLAEALENEDEGKDFDYYVAE
jgi:hypothetical protein